MTTTVERPPGPAYGRSSLWPYSLDAFCGKYSKALELYLNC